MDMSQTLFPFPYTSAFPAAGDLALPLFYNNPALDAVQLNIVLGGYAPSWTTTIASQPANAQVYYMPGLKPVTAGVSYLVDGGVMASATEIDTWRYSGSFDLNNTQVLARYVAPDAKIAAPVVAAGYRRYGGVATISAWGGDSFVQCWNFGHPVWYEQWYSANTEKTNAAVTFNGYTFFGDMGNNNPYIAITGGTTYVRRYFSGIYKASANIETLQDADIMYGAVFDGTATGGTAKIIVNGVVVASLTADYPSADKTVYSPWETGYGGPTSAMQGLAGWGDRIAMNWGLNELYRDILAPFDTHNVKCGWYVDHETGAPGVLNLDTVNISGSPYMMFTHPGWPSSSSQFWTGYVRTYEAYL